MKTKIESHGNEVTDFYDEKVPKVDFNHICLAVIGLDSAIKKYEDYYSQVFLKESKYIEEEGVRHIINDLEISADDSNDSDNSD